MLLLKCLLASFSTLVSHHAIQDTNRKLLCSSKRQGRLTKEYFFNFEDAQPFIESNDDDDQVEYHVFDYMEEATVYLETPVPSFTVDNSSRAPASKKRRLEQQEEQNKPTKQWEEQFALLKESLENGFTKESCKKLEKFMNEQRYQYTLFQQGDKPTSSSMTTEKIARLRAIGFKLPVIPSKTSAAPPQPPPPPAPIIKPQVQSPTPIKIDNRKIYKQWHENRNALKQYMDTHDGSYEIQKDDEKHEKLKLWLENQQAEYKNMMNGHVSNMTKEKIQLLKDIGVEFQYVPFNVRLQQLTAFKLEHGHVEVPPTHPELGKWLKSIRRQCKTFVDTKESTRDVNPARYAQLYALGVDPKKRWSAKFDQEEAQRWDVMYEKLVEYKNQHGNTSVKCVDGTKDLYSWLNVQRSEYKKLQENKPSRLTAQRLMKFSQVGFEFNQRGSYKTWEQRVEQIKEYKQANGHVRIPVTDPELGVFVRHQRANYIKLK